MKVLFVFTLLLSFPQFLFSQESGTILVEFNPENKKTFFRGEAVILNIIVKNNSDEDKAICFFKGASFFSKTYNKPVGMLREMVPRDYVVYEEQSSHPHRPDNSPALSPNRGCDLETFYNSIVPKGSEYNFSVVLSNCLGNHNCSGVNFLLPVGVYQYTVQLPFNDGQYITKLYEFEIIEANPQQKLYLKKLAEIFDYDKPGEMISFFSGCHDADIKDKSFTLIYDLISENKVSVLNFWLNNLNQVSNEIILTQQINEFVEDFGFQDETLRKHLNADRLAVYNTILKNLEDRDLSVSESFVNFIASFYSPSRENASFFEPIPASEIEKMQNYIKKRKKEKED